MQNTHTNLAGGTASVGEKPAGVRGRPGGTPRRYTLDFGAKRKLVIPAVMTQATAEMLDALVARVSPVECQAQSRSAVIRRLIELEHENPRIPAGTVEPRNRWDEPQRPEGKGNS